MMAGCFMHLIYDEVNRQIEKRAENNIKLRILNRIAFLSILTMTAVSRMYFATHFLHQCLFGCILGIIISILINRSEFFDEVSNFKKSKWLKIAIFMSITTTVIFWLHKLISGNPMSSVHLAFKYCNDPLYPKPETTVVFSSIRAIALICGFLINAPIKKR
jgi:glucose-6-phosphatase